MSRIVANFDGIRKTAKNIAFKYDGKQWKVRLLPNPYQDRILVSIWVDDQIIIENRVALLGEEIIGAHSRDSFLNKIYTDFIFMSDSEALADNMGFPLTIEDMNDDTHLYAFMDGDIKSES